MFRLGIDPGLKGGIALLEDHQLLVGARMPIFKQGGKRIVDGLVLDDIVFRDLSYPQLRVVIEDVHAMPKQGVSSTFAFGKVTGGVETWAHQRSNNLVFYTPRVWKGALGLSSDKRQSLALAATLWPGMYDWSVRANDGIAEAALLAYYDATVEDEDG